MALCGLWQMMTPLYIVLDGLLIAAYMCKDWDAVSSSICEEAEAAKASIFAAPRADGGGGGGAGMCEELPLMRRSGEDEGEADQ